MAKRTEPNLAWTAYQDARGALRAWLGSVPADRWSAPSVLPGWTVTDLAAHMVRVDDSYSVLRPAGNVRAHSLADYLASYQQVAEEIADVAREIAADSQRQPEQILATWDERFAAAAAVVDGLGLRDHVVRTRRLPIRLADFLVTRIVEIVVHADDFARSLADLDPPTMPREAERLAMRGLLDVLAERAPGRSVEVRVPPHAAVQCVEGPRHKRGTPPGVVEMSPTAWLRLAAGRTSWPEAVAAGAVLASGERTDLAGYLPLL